MFSSVWTIFLVILFFGGSIFVHELGHFLAARRRGVHVERFSIGFGPAIFSWRRDGVEYRIAWIPLGGYVLLPQLADIAALEGKSEYTAGELPPVSYASRMIVFVAGAVFNVIFALGLACILWVAGVPENSDSASTRIGYVARSVETAEHVTVPSPAFEAGLQVGDTIKAIDGSTVSNWGDVQYLVVLGAGRAADGQRVAVFTIERGGRIFDVTVHPRLVGEDRDRKVGIAAGYELLVQQVVAGSAAEKAGLLSGDEILKVDGTAVINAQAYFELIEAGTARAIPLEVRRGAQVTKLTVPARANAKPAWDIGVKLTTGTQMTYPSPATQITRLLDMTFRTLSSLVNPHSDIGARNLSGPLEIIRIYHMAAEAGMRAIVSFTILFNVNLAIFNLLPIPILDGGQMLFATLGRIRRRPLPANFIVAAQSLAGLFLIVAVFYVSYFNIQRWREDTRGRAAAEAAARQQQTQPPHATPAKP